MGVFRTICRPNTAAITHPMSRTVTTRTEVVRWRAPSMVSRRTASGISTMMDRMSNAAPITEKTAPARPIESSSTPTAGPR